jgi:tryptophan-rich sensory protein
MNAPPCIAPRGRALRPALVTAMAVAAVALGGTLLTDLGPWYAKLHQPPWKPPDPWFGPAWTLIYTLLAVAAVRAWLGATRRGERRCLLWSFGLNACLNMAWSGLFFKLRRPDWALAEVTLFWLSILALILVTRRTDILGAWLLLPYLLWVAFAAVLNLAVVRLNAPF